MPGQAVYGIWLAYGSSCRGDIAGKVAAEAVKKQDVSREALWDYDVGWKRGLGGAILASFDAIRIMCQSVPNDELDFLLAKGGSSDQNR